MTSGRGCPGIRCPARAFRCTRRAWISAGTSLTRWGLSDPKYHKRPDSMTWPYRSCISSRYSDTCSHSRQSSMMCVCRLVISCMASRHLIFTGVSRERISVDCNQPCISSIEQGVIMACDALARLGPDCPIQCFRGVHPDCNVYELFDTLQQQATSSTCALWLL